MENLHGPYAPDAIFFCTSANPDEVVSMKNPIEEYEAFLLQLRKLYSRTKEDLLRECGRKPSIGPPVGPNDNRATLPRRGAQKRTYEQEDIDIKKEELHKLLIQHEELESKCILCGAEDDVRAHRMAISYEDGRHDEPHYWLSWLNLIPLVLPDYREHYDEITNLVLLCPDHADAYDCGAWRWIPSEQIRSSMLNACTHDGQRDETGIDPHDAHTTLERRDKFASFGTEKTTYDLLIFLPQAMPKIDLLHSDLKLTSVAVAAEVFQSTNCPRILRAFRTLRLDPYLTYASTLRMVGAAYLPLPDDDLKAVEGECLQIRTAWNSSLRTEQGATELCESLAEFVRKRSLFLSQAIQS
ncbi:hypothetical protein ONZ51_g9390 [Trametes cubensis]|uniref:Uncharacterized protein n=1 Tax=Trametes cubensis TaxID=1111947 RepID=A0AAD7TLV9_9APHY|nr:hypothetical protein ONZ51_g9390 [Trametes cubensis]